MRIFIRADASEQIGSGHVMRCLTLADELRKKAEVAFICRELPGDMRCYIEQQGYRVHWLPFDSPEVQTESILRTEDEPIDWVIVDHYCLGKQWESKMRPYVNKIMVIDDLANREHDCDLLLDQNLYENMENRYCGLVPEHCKQLLGPKFALLRPEFLEARKKLRKRDGAIKRIFVFMSGSDPTNETSKALEAIKLLNRPDISVDVVVGASNPHQEQIKRLCRILNATFHCQVSNMAELMSKADLAIGAGGSTTWERCCLGLPSVVVILAKNQEQISKDVARTRAIFNLGWAEKATVTAYSQVMANLSPLHLEKMHAVSLQIVDGTGVGKTIKAIYEF